MTARSAHSLAVRTTVSILTVVALVGAFYLGLGYFLSMERETKHLQTHLQELLDTVERPASIACFLRDPQLAREVANGLLANSVVEQAVIVAGDATLAQARRGDAHADAGGEVDGVASLIVRPLVSPFGPAEVVGEIRIIPDQDELEGRILETSLFIAVLMLVQIVALGVTVALVVYGFVTRPLKRVVAALLGLPAEHGARLPVLEGHRHDEIGELIGYVNRLLDRLMGFVEQERDLRRVLAIEGQRFRSIFENAQTGIFLVDEEGRMLSSNPACRRLLHGAEAAAEAGEGPFDLTAFFGDAHQARQFLERCRERDDSLQCDVELRPGGEGKTSRWVQLTLTPIGDEMFQGVVNDITGRKLAEVRALRAARSDPLTGLLNRAGFRDAVRARLSPGACLPRSWVALFVVDLDLFKEINDTYGHAAGDRVLRAVARRLRRLVRKSDPVGRFGGDEFVVLLSGLAEPGLVEKVARKIVESMAREIALGDGRTVRVGVSVGIALSPMEAASRSQLFKEADEAMYQAKKAGRDTYRYFSANPSSPRAIEASEV